MHFHIYICIYLHIYIYIQNYFFVRIMYEIGYLIRVHCIDCPRNFKRLERAETDSSQIPLSKYVWTKEGLAAFAPEDTLWEDDATGKKDLPGSKDSPIQ